jgi:prepilin-type N-terminal cleavage/methylation domain-containing protein
MPEGFSLIEIMIALIILTYGLLAAGQLMYVTASAGSLARSKGTAALAAQDKLEFLADLYRQNPSASDLAVGDHGPEQVRIVNPVNGTTLNCYGVSWNVSSISDPRPGKALPARRVRVTVIPIQSGGAANKRAFLNKIINVTSIFSPRTP